MVESGKETDIENEPKTTLIDPDKTCYGSIKNIKKKIPMSAKYIIFAS